ncbi:Hypothetical protein A7982_11467 [Minicystis rosea]|nr:Hypothetical protein A7982_11467 [Minicystis rosea]
MTMKTNRITASAWLLVALAGVLVISGCSSCNGERFGLEGGSMDDSTALAAISRAETTGKLDGLEIEHYVGGGLPPPHYRSEQFRLFVDHGRDTIEFVTPDFTTQVKQGEAYPRHVYKLTASPSEVRSIAGLVRECGAFSSPAPVDEKRAHDSIRTELSAIVGGKEAKRVYSGAEPAALTKLRAVISPLIARLKAQGEHRLVP